MKRALAVYRSIALDIAKRILNEEFPEGTKISGRTLLASQYSVSPETIRKAVSILKEANIVSVSQGKEILVASKQQAQHFILHHLEMFSAYSLRQELELLMEKKDENDRQFHKIVDQIMHYSDRLKNLTPYNPVEVLIPAQSAIVGKALKDIRLWHNTGATVVAIRRGTELIVSPGPDAVLNADDRIVAVGTYDVFSQVSNFVNQ